MWIYSDDPMRINIDLLKRMDDDAPGTWLGSVKHNGYRRFATKENGKWVWRAKPAGSGELKEMPRSLREEFEALDLPDDLVYDMEWIGTRMVAENPIHKLMVFDAYPLIDCPPFNVRMWWLADEWCSAVNVHLVEHHPNPGLVDLFQRQLCDDASEGIVVRRADSKIIGNAHRCVEHPHVRKCLKGHLKELPK